MSDKLQNIERKTFPITSRICYWARKNTTCRKSNDMAGHHCGAQASGGENVERIPEQSYEKISWGKFENELHIFADWPKNIWKFARRVTGKVIPFNKHKFRIIRNSNKKTKLFSFLSFQLISKHEAWRRFIMSIFYVGKGKSSRPFSHLYDAIKIYKGIHSIS